MDTREKIIIIGGGFAGINLVKKLDKKKFNIVLIDKNNYHSFPPLFYQIASSGLDASSICFPFRREMRTEHSKGTRFHMGEVKSINTAEKTVTTQYETLPYDKLIIAAGCTNNFFGNSQLIDSVFTIKTVAQATRCRNEILSRLERACTTYNLEERRRLLQFVVIGGGPTGVEIAGALGEMKRDIVPREYTTLNPDDVKIILLEAGSKLLPAMSEKSSEKANEYLKKLMVDVRLNCKMESYNNNIVKISDSINNESSEIYSETVIWTAGITGISFDFKGCEAERGPGNRFVVDEYNRIKGMNGVFAVGDIAYLQSEKYPHGYPQLAQVAIQQANLLAKQINEGAFTKQFEYHDKGSMATVGRNLAVADLPKAHFNGFFAWLVWMFIHLISILGMRNKVTVLINWIWAYFTYNTSLRLILNPSIFPRKTDRG